MAGRERNWGRRGALDSDLAKLERSVKADPSNEELVRRYERALIHRGARAEVLRRYRAKFRCEIDFEALDPTDDPWVRHCRQCGRDVHFVTSLEEVATHVARGECVAVQEEGAEGAIRGLVDHPASHSALEPNPPCIVGRRSLPRLPIG